MSETNRHPEILRHYDVARPLSILLDHISGGGQSIVGTPPILVIGFEILAVTS
jgi:hypothetical protein